MQGILYNSAVLIADCLTRIRYRAFISEFSLVCASGETCSDDSELSDEQLDWLTSDLCDALGLPDGKPLSDEDISDVLLNAMEQK